ncbi:MAG: hypothetical protein E6J34_11195 [Chloroflexi bacterium]|nr:MAG: hypothetical protein E6J34_11195 [Chloroflexota bacterium]
MYAENHHLSQKSCEHQQEVTERQPLRCANCEIEILWPPTVVQDITYCCTGCAAGGPCSCDYSQYRSVNIAGVIHYRVSSEDATAQSGDRPVQQ